MLSGEAAAGDTYQAHDEVIRDAASQANMERSEMLSGEAAAGDTFLPNDRASVD